MVAEVGLGGTMDATNVVPAPVVCGITSLGLEHTNVLGNTLALIARECTVHPAAALGHSSVLGIGEKAGILKPGHPAFVSPQEVPRCTFCSLLCAVLSVLCSRFGSVLSAVCSALCSALCSRFALCSLFSALGFAQCSLMLSTLAAALRKDRVSES